MRLPDDRKRQAILAAAAHLFSTQPFHKVRLDDVASAAGVGKGTLYIYFTSKEDLYFSILYGGFSQLVDQLTAKLRDDHSSPWDRIQLIVSELVGFAFAHPELFELMRKVGLPATGNAEWNIKREELFKMIRDALQEGVRAGQLQDSAPELTALYLPGFVRSVMLYGPRNIDQQALIDHMLTVLAKGIMIAQQPQNNIGTNAFLMPLKLETPRTAPLITWLTLQLIILLVPITQLQLSDKFPQPAERLAIDEMLVGQISLSSLLLPVLFMGWGTNLAIIVSSWPFVLLAAVLSATTPGQTLAVGIYLSAWLLILACWSCILPSPSQKLTATAIAALLSIGTAVLYYLHVEFTFSSTNPTKPLNAWAGPIGHAIIIIHGMDESNSHWYMLAALLLASITSALIFSIWRGKNFSQARDNFSP